MNIQQLEYIISLDIHRNFVDAANACGVKQATLSGMIKKLEDELQLVIFDRSKVPVVPTEIGKKIVLQAKIALKEINLINTIVSESFSNLNCEINIGIETTIGISLLPIFIKKFRKKYPTIKIKIFDLTSQECLYHLKNLNIDAAIMAFPIHGNYKSQLLYYESFCIYDPNELITTSRITEESLNHYHICNLDSNLSYYNQDNKNSFQSKSLESLKIQAETENGLAILPELYAQEFSKNDRKSIKEFSGIVPARQIGLISCYEFVKKPYLDILIEEIRVALPKSALKIENRKIISMNE